MATDGVASRASYLDIGAAVFDGRFRIEERIAEGGFAVVYKAWQVALDRRVALKILKPPRGHDETGRAEFRDKFATEAKTIARLRHPHIVDVYDFSVSRLPSGELAPWMALEWLEGETLAMHLGRRRGAGERGRGPRQAVDFLRPVLEALAQAHRQGIVHRDIKPSNIMVTETAGGSSLRVLDFGIAKLMVDDHSPSTGNTRTESAPVFSPAYAAPEQVAFSRTGPWTDVHALGLILSEVMTDEAPFVAIDPDTHLFEQVMAPLRPTPARKGRDVGRYESIIAKALTLSPRDRWKNAGELLAALDDAAASKTDRGIVASPSPVLDGEPAQRESKVAAYSRVRRGLALAGLVAVLAMVLLVSILVFTRVYPPKREATEPHPPISPGTPRPPKEEPAGPQLPDLPHPPSKVAPEKAKPSAPPTIRRRREKKTERPTSIPDKDGSELFDDTK